MDMSKAQRPLEALKYLEERYPKIWRLAAFAYTAKSDPEIGGWPSYCWIPMAAWRAIVDCDVRVMPLAAAAGTWRLSKGRKREEIRRNAIKTRNDTGIMKN